MNGKFNILVVDDDLKNIQVGINFLKKNEKYHLVFATNGKQALKRVKDSLFDLILLDIMMPEMDGYEVCRRLKEDEHTRDIPVLFLTAKQGADNLVKGFEAGGADYITKPFNSHELMARVKTHIELHYQHKKEIERLQDLLYQSQRAETIIFRAKGIAHDCNNFLNVIAPNIQKINSNVKKGISDPGDYETLFQGIVSSVRKTANLLRQFSDFGNEKKNQVSIVDMNVVVSDLVKIYRSSLNNTVDLKIDFLSQPALALADIIHIEQVLLNMIINADHAICSQPEENRRGGAITLTVSKVSPVEDAELNSASAYLKIDVEDNGIGMSQETMDLIFNPYFSTRKNEGGSGLGLAVARSIVKSHKGDIRVSSELGKGSCFSIYFPFYEEKE
ncbi:MAG: response regulator [Spirochaetaceae bacterium]|nr:response regulator [Spirochaetaceae bacterium]